MGNRTNDDIDVISLERTNLTFIPQGLEHFFPNMIGIYMFNTSLAVLNGNELNKYVNLTWFAVEESLLERVPGNFFDFTPNVVSIWFIECKINHLGANLFQPLNITALKLLSFVNNVCINEYAFGDSNNNTAIRRLIDNVISKCPDIQETTTEGSKCWEGDLDEMICSLIDRDAHLTSYIKDLEGRINRLEELVLYRTTDTPSTSFDKANLGPVRKPQPRAVSSAL